MDWMRCPNCNSPLHKFMQLLCRDRGVIVRKYVCKNKSCNALIQTEEKITYINCQEED